MLGGQAMVAEYPISKSLPFECSAKHAVPLGVSATGVYLTKYTAKSATGKKKRFKLNFLNSFDYF
jgi:hypothetical protein